MRQARHRLRMAWKDTSQCLSALRALHAFLPPPPAVEQQRFDPALCLPSPPPCSPAVRMPCPH